VLSNMFVIDIVVILNVSTIEWITYLINYRKIIRFIEIKQQK
jgi:hypothetical protein